MKNNAYYRAVWKPPAPRLETVRRDRKNDCLQRLKKLSRALILFSVFVGIFLLSYWLGGNSDLFLLPR